MTAVALERNEPTMLKTSPTSQSISMWMEIPFPLFLRFSTICGIRVNTRMTRETIPIQNPMRF